LQRTGEASLSSGEGAITAKAIVSAMAYAIGQPGNADINEILMRPTAQPH
jgi:NADP-dependent 3-hydroxy acid dehydrogenase YdfG